MAMRCVMSLVLVLMMMCVMLASEAEGRRRPHKVNKKRRMHTIVKDLESNVTALWREVKQLGQPVHVHLEGGGHVMEPPSPPHHPHPHPHHPDHPHHQNDGPQDSMSPSSVEDEDEDRLAHAHKSKKMRKSHRRSGGDMMMMRKKMKGHGHHSRGGGEGEEEMEEWEEKYLHQGPAGTHVYIHLHTGEMESKDHQHLSHQGLQEYRYARCDMVDNSALPIQDRQQITGTVFFRQMPGQTLEAEAVLEGFEPLYDAEGAVEPRRGLHGHQYGDLTDGCNSLGGHINPYGVDHGGPEAKHRHQGDFGNIEIQPDGRSQRSFTDDIASLFGTDSLLGRSLVIHTGPDDHGKGHSAASKKFGNAGGRLACCVIAACSEPDGVWAP